MGTGLDKNRQDWTENRFNEGSTCRNAALDGKEPEADFEEDSTSLEKVSEGKEPEADFEEDSTSLEKVSEGKEPEAVWKRTVQVGKRLDKMLQ